MPNGILIVDKPAGWTSQDVAAKLRGVFHEKRVGHGGTLDPMATGVLPIFLGRATRAVPFFEHADKVYEATLRLGLVTDTQDITGRTLEEHPVNVTQEQLEAALSKFRGEIRQIPPMYSAIKVNGQKLYALARQGKEIERAPKPVTIYELTLVGAVSQGISSGSQIEDLGRHLIGRPPEATGNRQQATESADKQCLSLHTDVKLLVHCSKGTYVRTLCHDIGAALGCGGCMAALRRTRAGRYGIEQAHTLEEILAAPDPEALLLPVDSLFSDRPAVNVNELGEKKLRNGASLRSPKLADGEYRVYGPQGDFLALCAVTQGQMDTVKSFFAPL
ncbi:MAG: tRNA pseudouridine(55) synthase TruB [Oscillospiraceae bacterium]|nr:tRNA pseudouridine(55) synthase TruB [Oscillospiraceae bacterium]